MELAELLLNLDSVEGFERPLNRLRTEDDAEATIAELEAGAALYRRAIPFRFVKESGSTGQDYDMEAVVGNTIVACEGKCRIEGPEWGESKLRGTLNQARSQLPTDRPTLIFVKLPESWTVEDGLVPNGRAALAKLLGNSGRVSVVVFHWQKMWSFGTGGATAEDRYRIINNPKARFPLPQFGEIYTSRQGLFWRTIDGCLFPDRSPFCPYQSVISMPPSIVLPDEPIQ
jgi:hypothetical protein